MPFPDSLVPYFHVFMTLCRVKVSNEVGLSSLSFSAHVTERTKQSILSAQVSDTVSAYVGRDVYGSEIDTAE